jgi:hypothetical protein
LPGGAGGSMADRQFKQCSVPARGAPGAVRNHRTRGGNGVFKRKEVGDMDEAWIAIVVGRKPDAGKSRADKPARRKT